MVGKSCLATLGSANSFGIWVCALTSKGRSVCSFGSTGGGYCVWLFHIKQKYFVQQHSFLCSNIQHSTFPHQPKAGGPLTADRPTMHRKFLRISDVRELWAMKRILSLHSREGNVLHAFLLLAFAFLIFTREYSVSLLQSARIAPSRAEGLLATSLLNRNPYGFPINGSPVF